MDGTVLVADDDRTIRTVLTQALTRKQYGERVDTIASRFLEELPTDDLVWEGRGFEKSREEKQEIGAAHLANLKNLFD